ncbi:hypothetical protein mvi_64320 (plasmid) [Methylobacterium indicum]|uniref:Uncharacterized protein n=1 Tax=Methylobacterium indicum TaxID=1775910 RepID=A0A8H8X0I2_9HYPH|nr:hypothetical protein mvi_64320 [Methylobacterium indicum]
MPDWKCWALMEKFTVVSPCRITPNRGSLSRPRLGSIPTGLLFLSGHGAIFSYWRLMDTTDRPSTPSFLCGMDKAIDLLPSLALSWNDYITAEGFVGAIGHTL